MSCKMMKVMVLLSVILFVAAVCIDAQVTSADIVGTVFDATGATVPNAQVTVENVDTHVTRTAASNEAGDYVFSALLVGHYTVHVTAASFKAFTMGNITLAPGDRMRVDAHMEVGEVTQTVEVQAQSTALQTDSSAVQQLVDERAVQDLPLNARNFIAFAQNAPGANEGGPNTMNSGTRPDDRRASSSFAVSSMDTRWNSYLLDGIDNFDRIIGTIVVKPSIDAIGEFQVKTGLYPAELGRAVGGVFNMVTKSGSDSYHGSLYDYFRNDKMDAQSFEFTANAPKAEYRQNMFGGSVGGPIKKGKTFFFLDNENARIVKGIPWISTVPTLAERGGDFSALLPNTVIYDPTTTVPSTTTPGKYTRTPFAGNIIPPNRLDPIAKYYMQLYPTPQSASLSNNFSSAAPQTMNYSTMDVRIDHHFSQNDTLFGKYAFNDDTTLTPGPLPPVSVAGLTNIYPGGGGTNAAYPGPALQRAQGGVGDYVHIFSPTFLLDVRAGYTRYSTRDEIMNYGKNVSAAFGIPGANYNEQSAGLTAVNPTGFESLGDAIYIPYYYIDNTYQLGGSVSWTKGAHAIKFGMQVIDRRNFIYQSPWPRGLWNIDSTATNNAQGVGGNTIASWLLGMPTSTQFQEQLYWPGLRTWEPTWYIQDDWRATSWLTFNIGLRYDIYTPYTEAHGQFSNLNMSTLKIAIPGVNGASSTADVNTFYGDIGPRIGFAATLGHGTVLRGGYGIVYQPTNSNTSAFLRNPPFLAAYGFTNSTTNPVATLGQGFPAAVPVDPNNPTGALNVTANDFRPTAAQQINLTLQKQIYGSVLSVGYVATLARHDGFSITNIDQPLPGPGTIQTRRPYYSQLPLVTQINYVCSDYTANYHSLQATFEHRYSHGFSLRGNFTWAHGLGTVWASQLVTTDYRLEYSNLQYDVRRRATMAADYELPFGKNMKGIEKQLIAGWQMNAMLVLSDGMPFSILDPSDVANIGSSYNRPNQLPGVSAKLSNWTVNHFFNTSAFQIEPQYTVGDIPPFSVYGPPERHLDYSLFKNFPIKESIRMQFRAEFYNITNTPTFANPGGTVGTSAFGVVSGIIGTPRQVQLALKVLF